MHTSTTPFSSSTYASETSVVPTQCAFVAKTTDRLTILTAFLVSNALIVAYY